MAIAQQVVYDAAGLPTTRSGPKSVLWWGILWAIVIESAVFVLMFASLLYLRSQEQTWPPARFQSPDLFWATISTVLLAVTAFVQNKTDRLAIQFIDEATHSDSHDQDYRNDSLQNQIRNYMGLFLAFGLLLCGSRILEFQNLYVRWDTNAYGSIVWGILSLHTLHVVSSLAETAIVVSYTFLRYVDAKHALDLHVTSLYWYFVVFFWIPTYALVYWGPHFLN